MEYRAPSISGSASDLPVTRNSLTLSTRHHGCHSSDPDSPFLAPTAIMADHITPVSKHSIVGTVPSTSPRADAQVPPPIHHVQRTSMATPRANKLVPKLSVDAFNNGNTLRAPANEQSILNKPLPLPRPPLRHPKIRPTPPRRRLLRGTIQSHDARPLRRNRRIDPEPNPHHGPPRRRRPLHLHAKSRLYETPFRAPRAGLQRYFHDACFA